MLSQKTPNFIILILIPHEPNVLFSINIKPKKFDAMIYVAITNQVLAISVSKTLLLESPLYYKFKRHMKS